MARQAVRGNIEILWLSSAPADPTAPTQAEISAGVNYRGTTGGEDAESINGFDAQDSTQATQGLSSLTDTQIGGATTLGSPDILYYLDNASNPIYDAVTKGDQGWILVCPYGSDAGAITSLHEVEVTGKNFDLSDITPKWRLGLAQKTEPVTGNATA